MIPTLSPERKAPQANYRKLFIEAADMMYGNIRSGVTTIEEALEILKGILENKFNRDL